MGGEKTFTRKGAVRVLKRDIKAEEKRLSKLQTRLNVSVGVGMTWQEAERLACKWLISRGYRDAAVTAAGADGGVDIRSRKVVAQVKHQVKAVGVAEVQRLAGIAGHDGKKGFLFSSGGFTRPAIERAKAMGVILVTFEPFKIVS